MSKYLFLFFIMIFTLSCSFEEQVSNIGEAIKIKDSNDDRPSTNSDTLNENSNATSPSSNNSVESSDQNNMGMLEQEIVPKLISTDTNEGKNRLLEKIKSQFYDPSVALKSLPKVTDFKNIRELILAANKDSSIEQEINSAKKKSVIDSRKNSKNIIQDIEFAGGFYDYALNNIIENKLYFAYFSYHAYYDPEYYSQYWIPERIPFVYYYEYLPCFFLRIKDENVSIQSINSKAPHLVYHIYDDGKTIGINDYSKAPITITVKNTLTDETSTLELIFTPLAPYDDNDYGVAFAPPRQPNSTDYTHTNNQVGGVSESDRVKTDGNYIYSIHQSSFKIYDIKKEEQIASLKINFNNFSNTHTSDKAYLTPPSDDYNQYIYSVINFYNDNMIAFSQSNQKTMVSYIDISNKSEPKVTKQLTFNSSLSINRIIDNKIVLMFNDYLRYKHIDFFYRYAFTTEQKKDLTDINLSEINKLSISDFFLDLTLIKTENEINEIIKYDDADNLYFDDNQDAYAISRMIVLDSKGVVLSSSGIIEDYSSNIYITPKSIFLFNTNWSNDAKTDIYYFDLQNFKLDLKGALNIRGTPINKFCFHETKDYLLMAFHDSYKNENGIYTISLIDELKVTNTLSGIAPGESLKSVRFVNNKAYVVTFKVVDPLFIIDFEKQNSPKILGEIKVSGYSTYLHEIYDDILLGVGYEADENGRRNGSKVSTFNVKEDNLFEIDKAITIDSSYVNNIVFNASLNYLDFVWYNSRNLLALTYSTYNNNGFIVYRLNSKGEILDAANVKLEDRHYYYKYEDKIIFIGDNLYYIENNNIKIFPINSLNFLVENKMIQKK